ncbi:MAG: hypothetical protein ACTHKJ_08630 [Candidatus Nitrosocosmicus sp.]
MVDIIDQINYEIEKYSLLKHDFYKLWQEGKLSLDHLTGYSQEYFQMVKIVPSMVKNALENNLEKKNIIPPYKIHLRMNLIISSLG